MGNNAALDAPRGSMDDVPSAWQQELLDLARAFSGGMLFGVPLFYTMEVWWIGSHTDPRQMLLILGFIFTFLMVLNKTAGFRSARDVGWVDAIQDSVEALAVGIVATIAIMLLLRRVSLGEPTKLILGRILNESIPFCLGVGVARAILQGGPGMSEEDDDDSGDSDSGSDSESDDSGDGEDSDSGSGGSASGDGGEEHDTDRTERPEGIWAELKGSLGDLGAALLGATFIGLSIAPTDEVPMLASSMPPPWQVLTVVASLVISYFIVFVAGFAGQDNRHGQIGLFQDPIAETVATYLVAMLASLALLLIFQKGPSSPPDLMARVVVLSLPAAVGGAVGRLAL